MLVLCIFFILSLYDLLLTCSYWFILIHIFDYIVKHFELHFCMKGAVYIKCIIILLSALRDLLNKREQGCQLSSPATKPALAATVAFQEKATSLWNFESMLNCIKSYTAQKN